MKNITINVASLPNDFERYVIGIAGEANATTITFNAESWRTEYPTGVFALVIKRADDACYPCVITETGGVVTYVVSAIDASVYGFGYLQLQITQGDAILKSVIIRTCVEWSIGSGGAIPPEDAPWIQQVLDAKTDAEAAADASEAAAASAAASLQDLEDLADEFIGQYYVNVSGETLVMTRLQ